MKRIREMSRQERERLIRELEVIERVANVKATRLRREIKAMNVELAAFEQNRRDAQESIENLRSY